MSFLASFLKSDGSNKGAKKNVYIRGSFFVTFDVNEKTVFDSHFQYETWPIGPSGLRSIQLEVPEKLPQG